MISLTPIAQSAGFKVAPHSLESVPVNMGRLLEMADDDPSQLRELVDMYVKESTGVMHDLKLSVQAGDWDQTERLAHRLGGTSAVCGVNQITLPLRDLEMAAQAGHRSFNEMLLIQATHEHARAIEYLEELGLTEVAQ